MQKPKLIPPEAPYRPDSIDYNNVRERAEHGYFREYWSSYKGRVRGMLSGVAIGAALGAVVGLGLAPLLVPALEITLGVAVAAFSGLGALMAADVYGAAGSAAASRAAGLAERHARVLDPTYKGNEAAALDDKLMMDGRKHNFQFPEDRDKGKLFKWKSGLLGGAIAASVGALLAKGEVIAEVTSLSGLAASTGGAALVAGALGLTFGIDRSNLKGIFNVVDSATFGKIHKKEKGPDLGKAQFGAVENDKQLTEHRLRRQASTFTLEEEYHPKIFAKAVKGTFRGLAGGAVAGALIGAALGAAVFAVAAAAVAAEITVASAVADVGMIGVAKIFASAGALWGMKTFAEAGKEAGAESMARAIDNEFEKNLELRDKGITPAKTQPKPEHLFNLKATLIMGAVGAAVGLIAPLIATETLAFAGVTLASSMVPVVSTIVGGMVGAMYGIGSDAFKKLSETSDYLYNKTFVVHNDPTAQPYVVPTELPDELIKEAGIGHTVITQDDMTKMNERMKQNPMKSFEQKILTQQPQTMQQAL